MSFDWGPHFIVPSESMKSFSGVVRLRESLDEELLHKELEELGISGAVVKIANPWYFRRKGAGSWIKIGESLDMEENFPVKWDMSHLENGPYEVLGLMHVSVLDHETEHIIARQSIVDVTIEN
ncbi:MAG: hypothetical protein QG552_1382 [Thermodesulfobacteriota bacterium]|nr:hypothetical protein [Thermodesulfobacteriota bacterium]